MPKISELPLANKLKEEDYIPIVQDGVTKKVKGTHFVTEEEYSLDAFSPTITANDKGMYKFGEGDSVDFSDSTYDGAYKSAILKGTTLVNSVKESSEIKIVGKANSTLAKYQVNHIDTTKDYTVLFEINDFNGNGNISISLGTPSKGVSLEEVNHNGKFNILIPSSKIGSEMNEIWFYLTSGNWVDGNSATVKNIVLIEGDYTNVEIPYFEGMTSVRMPVLQTTGKNLICIGRGCDYIIRTNGLTITRDIASQTITFDGTADSNNVAYSLDTLLRQEIKKGERYAISCSLVSGTADNISFRVNTKDWSSSLGCSVGLPGVRTFNQDVVYDGCTFRADEGMTFNNAVFRVMFEKVESNSNETLYEPYKSNILMVNEPVELRGIGGVRDELNLVTGELTQRIGEIVLNGKDGYWSFNTPQAEQSKPSVRFSYSKPVLVGANTPKYNVKSDKLPTLPAGSTPTNEIFGIAGLYKELLYMYIPRSVIALEIDDNDITSANAKVKEYFDKLGDVEVQYELATESVKTVDLSGTPFGYKGGHIIKSSAEGSLLPKFEYEVAISRGAQISQNTSTLIKHDEKITELLKKTAATYINQKAEIAHLLNMSNTLEEVQTIPFIEDDYVNDDCMVDSDVVMDDMELEPEKEIIDNVDTLLINLIYDLIELNDTLGLSEKVELFRQSGLIDKHNYEIIKEKLNPSFKEEDYADINQ